MIDSKIIWSYVQPKSELPLTSGKLYLGSMFFLDFGNPTRYQSRSGKIFTAGELTISVGDVYWEFVTPSFSTNANIINEQLFQVMMSYLLGSKILCLTNSERNFQFNFDCEAHIVIDTTNKFDTDLNIFRIDLPDCSDLSVGIDGQIVLNDHGRGRKYEEVADQ